VQGTSTFLYGVLECNRNPHMVSFSPHFLKPLFKAFYIQPQTALGLLQPRVVWPSSCATDPITTPTGFRPHFLPPVFQFFSKKVPGCGFTILLLTWPLTMSFGDLVAPDWAGFFLGSAFGGGVWGGGLFFQVRKPTFLVALSVGPPFFFQSEGPPPNEPFFTLCLFLNGFYPPTFAKTPLGPGDVFLFGDFIYCPLADGFLFFCWAFPQTSPSPLPPFDFPLGGFSKFNQLFRFFPTQKPLDTRQLRPLVILTPCFVCPFPSPL